MVGEPWKIGGRVSLGLGVKTLRAPRRFAVQSDKTLRDQTANLVFKKQFD